MVRGATRRADMIREAKGFGKMVGVPGVEPVTSSYLKEVLVPKSHLSGLSSPPLSERAGVASAPISVTPAQYQRMPVTGLSD